MRRQRGFWNVVGTVVFVLLTIANVADLGWRFWRLHFRPSYYSTDPKLALRRRRIIISELVTLGVVGVCAFAFAKFGPIPPIHEWRH